MKNKLKIIKKELGKPFFQEFISKENDISSKIFMIFGAVFGIFISLILWYGFYLNQNDYILLAMALLLSSSFFIVYDVYKDIKYKEFVYIGDRGIAILQVNINNEKVKGITILHFDKIDKIIIDKKHHYSVGQGGEMVEHLEIVSDKKIIFDINPNKIEMYDKLKTNLLDLYTTYKVRNKEDIQIETNNKSIFLNNITIWISLFMVILDITYNIFDIDYYSKVVSLLSLISVLFLMIISLRLVVGTLLRMKK